MRLVAAFILSVMLMCIGVVPSHAEKRVALVVGNSTYSKVPRLPNPANDAGAIAALLRNAGFDVVQTKTNLDLASLRRAPCATSPTPCAMPTWRSSSMPATVSR